jgi:hypothetical protein
MLTEKIECNQAPQKIQSGDFSHVSGLALKSIKEWVYRNHHYIALFNYMESKDKIDPKKGLITHFISLIKTTTNLHRLALILSSAYRNYHKSHLTSDEETLIHLDKSLREQSSLFTSTTSGFLTHLENDFLKYLSMEYGYQMGMEPFLKLAMLCQ